MRYFTDNPLERMMMQVPRQERGPDPSRPAKGHPCHGCKRYGEGCILPCYQGVTDQAASTKNLCKLFAPPLFFCT